MRPMHSLWQASGAGPDLQSNSSYWLITRDPAPRGARRPEVFTTDLEDSKLLPVFSSEPSARWFLHHVPGVVDTAPAALADSGWGVRAAQSGELVSLLSGSAHSSGPCADVRTVIVDPPMEVFDRARRSGRPVGESYRSFLEHLLQQGRTRSDSSSSTTRA